MEHSRFLTLGLRAAFYAMPTQDETCKGKEFVKQSKFLFYGIRPYIWWFGEVPFELDRIFRAAGVYRTGKGKQRWSA
jgi:hypothetical protein